MSKQIEQKWITLSKKLAGNAKTNQKANATILKKDGTTGGKKALSVLITWEDVYSILEKQNFKCKYTNIPLEPGFGKFGHELYEAYHPLAPSLDRINNDEGYHIDNISITLRFINLGLGGYKGNNLNILKTLGLVK